MSSRSFTPELFAFLSDLADNNERPWFHENKSRYEHAVKEPALEFIEEFRPALQKISPHFEANARANGGSLFRINRDTRFAKDKTPYKLNTGMHFRHEMAKDAHAPGFYLHLQPRQSFAAAGLWRPEPKVAQQIRVYIGDNRARWKKVTMFEHGFELAGESLVRPPRGFEKDDALLDDLKRKDFIATTSLTQKEITASTFMAEFEQRCRDLGPFVHFLCDAVGVQF